MGTSLLFRIAPVPRGVVLCFANALLAPLLACAPASAATYYWDTNGATAGFGSASGTWGTSQFWSTDSSGSSTPSVISTTTADTLNFGTTAEGLGSGSIGTTGAAQGFNNLVFASSSGDITLAAGGTLNVAAAGNITVNGAASATLDATLAGSGGSFTKLGTGTLALTGNNTFDGGAFLGTSTVNSSITNNATAGSGGFVVLGHNNALGTGDVTVKGAQLRAATVGIVIPNDINIDGGALRFGGSNDLTLNGNLVLIGGNRAIANYTGNKTFTLTGTIDGGGNNITFEGSNLLSANGTTVVSNVISNAAAVSINTTNMGGKVILSGNNTYAGSTTVNSGTLELQGNNTTTGGTFVNAGATLVLNYGSQNNSKLPDGAVFNLSGGDVVLSGGSHIEVVGSTTIGAGAANVSRSSGSNVLQMNTITKNAGGTVNFAAASIATADNLNTNGILGGWATVGGANWATTATSGSDIAITALGTYSALATGAGTDTNNSRITASATLTGSRTTNSLKIDNPAASQSLALGSNTLTLTSGGLLLTGTNAFSITGGTLKSNTATNSDLMIHQYSSGSLTIGSIIANGAGTSTLTKAGSGTLTLTNASNSYTGITRINEGTVQIANELNLGATPGSTVATQLTLNGGTLATSANVSFSANRGITLSTGGGALNVIGNTTLTINSVIAGGGALTKLGLGTLTLTQASTYSGDSILGNGTTNSSNTSTATPNSGGFVLVGNNAALGTGTIEFFGAQIRATSGTLTLANPIAINNGGFRFGGSNNLAFSGLITLVGNNRSIGNYSGNKTLTLGGDIDTNGFLLSFEGVTGGPNGTTVVNGSVVGGGTVAVNANFADGTVIFGDDNSYAGITTISGGTLQIGNGGTTGTFGQGAVTNDSALVFNRTDDFTVTNDISGTGTVAKSGAGALTLTGNLTYQGKTILNNSGGAVVFDNGNTFTLTGELDLGNSTTFQVKSGNVTFDVSSGDAASLNNSPGHSATIQVDTGATLSLNDNFGLNTSTLNLAIDGTFIMNGSLASGGGTGGNTLNKSGSGTLIFTNDANNMLGSYHVNAGTLQIGNGGATGDIGANADAINVNAGATLLLKRTGTLDLSDVDLNFTSSAGNNATLRAMSPGTYNVGADTSNLDVINGGGGSVVWTADTGATLNINSNGAGTNIGFTSSPTLLLNGGGTGVINRSLASGAGAGSVVKEGTGTWTLTNTANAWATGGLTVNEGTLVVGAAEVIPNGAGKGDVAIYAPGKLDVRFDETINGLTGDGTVDKTAGAASVLTVGDNDTSSTFSGTLTNTGPNALGLTKQGAGTLTLTGTLSYSGKTAMSGNGGTLIFNTGNTFTLTGELDLGDNTTFRVQSDNVKFDVPSGDAGTVNNAAGNSALIQVDSGAALEFADNFGLLQSTLNLTVDGTLLFSGPLASGGGGGGSNVLNKNGTGLLRFTNSANNMIGNYNFNQGLTRFDGSTQAGAVQTTVGGLTGIAGTLEMINGASYTGSGDFRVGDNGGAGLLTVDDNSSLTTGTLGSANFVVGHTNATSNGTVILTSGAIHSLNQIVIGNEGVGAYTQNGGVTTADADLHLAEAATGVGTFTLNNGSVSVGQNTVVGVAGTSANAATLQVNGGTLTTPDLIVAQNANSRGRVNQTGGVVNVTNTSTLDIGLGGAGEYNLSGGTLNVAGNATLGDGGGSGDFYHTGGTANITGNLVLGDGVAPLANHYYLSGGVLDFGDSTGAMAHWGPGSNPASSINILADGAFQFSGGTLRDVTEIHTVSDAGAFEQNGASSRFYIGQDAGPGGYARQTTIYGGFSLLEGVVFFDAFGPDLTPEQCCDGVASQNDQLTVTGDVFLDSVVHVDYEGFTPEFGDVITLICANDIAYGDNFSLTGGYFRVVPTGLGPGQPQYALQALVPEPASVAIWTLMGLIGAAWGFRRRRLAFAACCRKSRIA